MIARTEIPMAKIGVVKSTLGWLRLIPRTVELMHGMTDGGEGCGGGTGGQLVDDRDTEDLEHAARVDVLEAARRTPGTSGTGGRTGAGAGIPTSGLIPRSL